MEFFDENYPNQYDESDSDPSDKSDDSDFELDYNPEPFYTNETFDSREALMIWAQRTGRELGFVIIKRRSNQKKSSGVVWKVSFACHRGGTPDKRGSKNKDTGTRKTNCPFMLEGHLNNDNGWRLKVIDHRHNHHPLGYDQGHAYLRRLSEAEKEFVERAVRLDCKPSKILFNLKEEFPENRSTIKDIYNIRKRCKKVVGEERETSMQVMFQMLQDGKYMYHYTTDGVSERLENLFFVHPLSLEIWRAFPWIVEIDATYKTNIYNMPLVEIVGVTSTGKTFSIAYAFIRSEREAGYKWVLQCLKSTLGEGFIVRVVLTDREQALMNACHDVWPEVKHLLCRFHIKQNIKKHCEPVLSSKRVWGPFHHWWDVLIQSPTYAEYVNNEAVFKSKLEDCPNVYKYLQKEWLSPYKERFVSCWVDEHLNFGNHATNRVESEHSLLKADLRGRATFQRILECINSVMICQVTEIKRSLEMSRTVIQHTHNIPFFKKLHGFVSRKALDIMVEELNRLNNSLGGDLSRCGCKVLKSCGLPCACRLALLQRHGRRISLDLIDIFWRKLDLTPSTCLPGNDTLKDSGDEDDDVLDDLKAAWRKQPKHIRSNWMTKIKDMLYPNKCQIKDPVVQARTRGRPVGSKKRKTKLPDLNKTPRDRASNLEKSRSVQRSEPNTDAPRGSQHQTPFAPYYSDRWSETSRSLHSVEPWARYSEYVPSQSRFADPGIQQHVGSSQYIEELFRAPDPHSFYKTPLSDFAYYQSQIPDVFHDYITRIENVSSDGNCGFRVLAVALGLDQDEYFEWVRKEMLAEYESNKQFYDEIFGADRGDQTYVRCQVSYPKGGRPPEYWMMIPNGPILLANRLGLIINCISLEGSQTVFPFWREAGDLLRQEHISIALVNDSTHFVMVELQGNYPMAYITPYLAGDRRAQWANVYRERLDRYDSLIQVTKKAPAYFEFHTRQRLI